MPSVEIPVYLHRLLTEQANAAGLPLSELINRAVSSYILLNDEAAKGQRIGVASRDNDTFIKEIPLPLLNK